MAEDVIFSASQARTVSLLSIVSMLRHGFWPRHLGDCETEGKERSVRALAVGHVDQ